jgi:hypothetical protein
MGSSVLWQTEKKQTKQELPKTPWASDVSGNHAAIAGEWYWEFSRNDLHQIHDAETIRPYATSNLRFFIKSEK